MPSLREVCLRHARHYLERLCAIEDESKRGDTEAQACKDDFLDEWEQIHGAQRWVEEKSGQDDAAAAVSSGYAAAASFGVTGASLLDLRQHPVDRARWLQSGLASARRLHDRQAESVHLY